MKEYIVGIENEHPHALDVCYKKELIRCKDCKWFTGDSNSCYSNGGTLFENDYCSAAERKEE